MYSICFTIAGVIFSILLFIIYSFKTNFSISENKIYNCTADANYILINDISFSAMDYITDYPEKFTETPPYTWEDNTVQTSEGTFRENFNDNGKNEVLSITELSSQFFDERSQTYVNDLKDYNIVFSFFFL